MLIAGSGKDLSKLTTKEEVHKVFGEPYVTGMVDGHPCEDYSTRRKIADPNRAIHGVMEIGYSWGTLELVAFPYELYLLGRRTLLGQDLRFAYDNSGNVIRVFLEGETLCGRLKSDGWANEEYEASQQMKEKTPVNDHAPPNSP